MRDRLLLVHAQHASEHARSLSLEDINDVAVRSPVQGKVLDQSVFWRFHLRTKTAIDTERVSKAATTLVPVDVVPFL